MPMAVQARKNPKAKAYSVMEKDRGSKFTPRESGLTGE